LLFPDPLSQVDKDTTKLAYMRAAMRALANVHGITFAFMKSIGGKEALLREFPTIKEQVRNTSPSFQLLGWFSFYVNVKIYSTAMAKHNSTYTLYNNSNMEWLEAEPCRTSTWTNHENHDIYDASGISTIHTAYQQPTTGPLTLKSCNWNVPYWLPQNKR